MSGKRLSGKVTVRETSCTGNVLSGKRLVIVRERSCPGSLGPPESSTQRHLDRFSRFCRAH